MSDAQPPVAKYRYTAVITGNTHDEIVRELVGLTRGGYLLDSDYEKRDEFHVVGGTRSCTLEHVSPDMTPERYDAELKAWWHALKAARLQQEANRE